MAFLPPKEVKKNKRTYSPEGSWIKNCLIVPRKGDIDIISGNIKPGLKGLWDIKVKLDGYAIIPIEKYEVLLSQQPPS